MSRVITNQSGHNIGFELEDVFAVSIESADYDPLAVAAASRTVKDKSAIDKGFFIRPSASGNVTMYGITHKQYRDNGNALTIEAGGTADLVPEALYCVGNQWELVRLIKVYANDDDSYASGATTINVGLL